MEKIEIEEKINTFIKLYHEIGSIFRENIDGVVNEITNKSEERLIFLFKIKMYHLNIFEVLLRKFPDSAIYLLKTFYLTTDLAESPHDQVADLEVMFDDIKIILGADKLQEILNCPEFLDKNKENRRVKEAIESVWEE